jgi:CheY-like chemotaxis protein
MTAQGPLSFLDRTVRVLAMDDDEMWLDLFQAAFASHPMYAFGRATTARQADALLKGEPHVRVCLCDLGVTDIDNDEFAIARRHGNTTACVVVSAREDALTRVFDAGAQHVVADATMRPADPFVLLPRVNYWFERNLFGLTVPGRGKQVLERLAELAIQHCPETVEQWHTSAGVSYSYLKALCTEHFGTQPEHVLYLCRAYCAAFALAGISPVEDQPVPTPEQLDQLTTEFDAHRSSLRRFLGAA